MIIVYDINYKTYTNTGARYITPKSHPCPNFVYLKMTPQEVMNMTLIQHVSKVVSNLQIETNTKTSHAHYACLPNLHFVKNGNLWYIGG